MPGKGINILVICSYYHPAQVYGGPVPALRKLNRTLARYGHKLMTYATAANGTRDLTEPLGPGAVRLGAAGDTLREATADLPGVHFPGFKQAEELPAFYGLAGAFICPSSHFEQWGLVVNEAMASGLPVLVSRACGCVPDLVHNGVNGFTFDPYDVEGLAQLMVKMSSGEIDLEAMGAASRRIIAEWTPEVFAQNLLKAVEAAQAAKKARQWWQPRQ